MFFFFFSTLIQCQTVLIALSKQKQCNWLHFVTFYIGQLHLPFFFFFYFKHLNFYSTLYAPESNSSTGKLMEGHWFLNLTRYSKFSHCKVQMVVCPYICGKWLQEMKRDSFYFFNCEYQKQGLFFLHSGSICFLNGSIF